MECQYNKLLIKNRIIINKDFLNSVNQFIDNNTLILKWLESVF